MEFNIFSVYALFGALREILSPRDVYILDCIRNAVYKNSNPQTETYCIKVSDIEESIEDLSAIDLLVLRNILLAAKDLVLKTSTSKCADGIILYVALVGAVHEQIAPF